MRLLNRVCSRHLHSRSGRFRCGPSRATPTVHVPPTPQSSEPTVAPLFYDGIVFDMDGTLTEGHIDFNDMRKRTRIPQGDLFTVLEASTPDHIRDAMATILEIEAEAAKLVSMKEGLLELLGLLKEHKMRVALVTRNTHASVGAFFSLIGPEWSSLFDVVLTREFPFVKPDKRLLLHVAKVWGVDPGRLLMVGDSFEDVEVGNAAGTATCLVAGGGNEKPGAPVVPPSGAVATLTVSGLEELKSMLEENGPSSGLRLGWPARVAGGETLLGPEGSPAPGLDFLDWCVEVGALRNGGASFPRMGQYAGGLATSQIAGSRVLHVACGSGGLTKTMCSMGVVVVGTDTDIEASLRRGLSVVPMVAGGPNGSELVTGSLRPARDKGPFEVVMLQGTSLDLADRPGLRRWWQPEPLRELLSVFEGGEKGSPEEGTDRAGPSVAGGVLCADVMLGPGLNPAGIFNSLHSCGVSVKNWQIVDMQHSGPGVQQVLRLVATNGL